MRILLLNKQSFLMNLTFQKASIVGKAPNEFQDVGKKNIYFIVCILSESCCTSEKSKSRLSHASHKALRKL